MVPYLNQGRATGKCYIFHTTDIHRLSNFLVDKERDAMNDESCRSVKDAYLLYGWQFSIQDVQIIAHGISGENRTFGKF